MSARHTQATIECYECDQPLSGHETTCPRCGVVLQPCPNPDRHALLPAGVGLVCPECGDDLTHLNPRTVDQQATDPREERAAATSADRRDVIIDPALAVAASVTLANSPARPDPVSANGEPILSSIGEVSVDAAVDLHEHVPKEQLHSTAASFYWAGQPTVVPGNPAHLVAFQFLSEKRYRIEERGFLEFQLAVGREPIAQLEMRITGSDGLDVSMTLRTLLPNNVHPLDPIAYVPSRAGEERLRVELIIFLAGGTGHRYLCHVPLKVQGYPRHIRIEAQRDVIVGDLGDMTEDREMYSDACSCWIDLTLREIPLHDNSAVAVAAPPPVLSSTSAVSGATGPERYYFRVAKPNRRIHVVPGQHLALGRNARTEDWALRVGDAYHYEVQQTRGISRHHCDLTIREGRVYLRDASTTGLALNSVRIPKDLDVVLEDGDTVNLAGAISLKISVQRASSGIGAVILQRLGSREGLLSWLVLLDRWVALQPIGLGRCGWLARHEGRVWFVSPNDERPGHTAASAKVLEHGARFEVDGGPIDIEASVTCAACGRSSFPVPDSVICGYCREPLTS